MSGAWRIVACDLDGTLIGRDHKVNERDLEALRQARAAGIHVAICTGRNAMESAGVIGALDLKGLGVFANGAMVAEMGTGMSVDSRFVEWGIGEEIVEFFGARGHGVLALLDDAATRLPRYLMTTHGPVHRGTTEWLAINRTSAETVDVIEPPYRERVVRLSVVVDVAEGKEIDGALRERFGGRMDSHSIYSPYYDCQVIEVFSFGTDKWTGIERLAKAMGIGAEEVIAIGDDVNDLAMLRGARLSFAMGNASAEVRGAAKRVTGTQKECGVAMVIDALLKGELNS